MNKENKQEKLTMKIGEMAKMECKFKKYLEDFDEQFETHTAKRMTEIPLLLTVFNEFIQENYKPSEIYNLALKLRNQIKDEMEETFTKEQLELIEQYQFYEDRMSEDMIEQAFIYGYVMNDELRYEAKRQFHKENNSKIQ